jgi:hypothetical protein
MATYPEPSELTSLVPPRKPMALARRVSLFQREIRVRLSSAAIEILFDAASVLSEGQVDGDALFASTMVTIDLARAADLVSDPCDETSTRQVAELVAADERVLDRARDIAYREARRLSDAPFGQAQIDVRARHAGVQLHLDMDIEAVLEEAV